MQRFTWPKQLVFTLLLITFVVGFLEIVAAVLLKLYPDIEHTRRNLMGDVLQEISMNSVAQPYLLYVAAPNYIDPATGIAQNNSDAYRGERVPVQRSSDTVRVLFMGGSTTYGEGVDRPEESYPAQFGQLLQQDPRFTGKKIEIINAGLRFGTTAEILTHYLLKFRYYRPDAVVINPGGNDPVSYLFSYYQPDYSHWRKQASALNPLPKRSAWLLRSKALSIPIVLLFFPDTAVGETFVHGGESMPASWFSSREKNRLQLDELAFYNNLMTVVQAMQSDGAQVSLLSYQGNPFAEDDQKLFRRLYDFEEQVLSEVAKATGAKYAPFPLAAMPKAVWVDPSHINAEGERIKARYAYEQFSDAIFAAIHSPNNRLSHQHNLSLELQPLVNRPLP